MPALLSAALSLVLIGAGQAGQGFERVARPPPAGMRAYPLDVSEFRVLQRDSGPHNYYRTMSEPPDTFIRGVYGPWLQTVTLFAPVPDELHRGVRMIRFRWRALVLPRGGNECVDGRGDSAANVYVTWKRGMRWYSVKLLWSTEADVGATCNGTRNPFVAQDSVILRSGGPTGVWHEEEIDPDALYRAHFEGGRRDAEVPELQGLGILTDGDQTHAVSAADYADFVFYKEHRTAAR